MPGVAVVGQDSAGGTQLGGGQDYVRVGGSIVVVLGDPVAGHGRNEHSGPNMAEGEPWYRINGIPVCREGHVASCGHASSGRPWYRVSPQ